MEPTIGRIVLYRTTQQERKEMEQNRQNIQEVLPAMIVAVWGPETVNLKVELDGNGQIWKTSSMFGAGEGQWMWPERK